LIKVGIDTLAFYFPRYALDLTVLAEARGVDPDKYTVGLGQKRMAVPPPGEDIVSMALNAANEVLQGINLDEIAMLLFATESSLDQSKAAGTYLHDFLHLPAACRIVELKQACYAATAALQLALPFLREHPKKKVLVVASDIARYGLNTTGESSQGAGAVAMLLSAHPRLLAIEPEYGVISENVMDFWRPPYLDHALVDGKYSSKLYLTMLEKSFKQYQNLSGRGISDHAYYCYHTPVPRLVEKAHQHLLKVNAQEITTAAINHIQTSLLYNQEIGNSYTASLYIALASVFDHAKENLTGKRIGFYSYGSGAVAEYFSAVVQAAYPDALHSAYHARLFAERSVLTYEDYVNFYQFRAAADGSEQEMPHYHSGTYRLAKLNQHQRHYEKITQTAQQNAVMEVL
jgi:hydroxymethylglutaryl-CoA synthase